MRDTTEQRSSMTLTAAAVFLLCLTGILADERFGPSERDPPAELHKRERKPEQHLDQVKRPRAQTLMVPKSIRVSSKTGIPLDVLPNRGVTAKQAERMTRINDSDLPRVSTQPRSREESTEERKARKQAIKEERKERRVEKKANKMAFKEEKVRQEKQMLNLRTNVQGLKL
ncbi:LTV1-like protein [Oryzias melastigma]|uniref:Protein LTV1 homolog n=1 Tax=Oryzias melastigma TaxID=30732 RepID=A0A834C8H2_ORYME|nr:LTV1-like protein [Oryzias melastigma]